MDQQDAEQKKRNIAEDTIADILMKQSKAKYYNLDYWRWEELCYVKFEEIDQIIQTLFDTTRDNRIKYENTITKNKITRRYVSEVKGIIERSAVPEKVNLDLVACKNVVIDITNRTINDKPNHEIFVPTKINCSYDKNADCPNIDSFIELVVGESYKDAVYESFGNCLIPRYDSKKITLFKGPGDSGKSTLLRILEKVLGEWNYSAISCYDFKYQFRLYNIVDKLAIISNDLPTGFLGDSNIGTLKVLSGNDNTFVEKKGKDGFMYRNRAKILYSSNFTPSLTKEQLQDDAFLRRWNIIKCEHKFSMGDFDYDSLVTEEELSGLLNKMLSGAKRLMNNKYFFSKESSIEENRVEFDKHKYTNVGYVRYDDSDVLSMDSEEMMRIKRENIYGKK